MNLNRFLNLIKYRLAGLVVLLMLVGLLAACGESTNTSSTLLATATVNPTALPPAPTATTAATVTPANPVVVIPPGTVTPAGGSTPPATNPVSTPGGPLPTGPSSEPQNPNTTPAKPVTGPSTVPAGQNPQATVVSSGPAAQGKNVIFYLKEGSLWAAVPGAKGTRQVASLVISYTPAGEGRAVFLQQSGSGPARYVELKMLTFNGTQFQESLLDSHLFETLSPDTQNSLPAGLYGLDTRAMGEMAVSPDNKQVAYAKADLSGKTFDGMFHDEKPTELWLATLDQNNPQPRRLAPSNNDYIAKPLWSSDNNRIAFLRTPGFGTGAGYATALWSVYKDGTRLSFLTGPDLGKIGTENFQAAPAFNLRWVGPLAIGFQVFNQVQSPIFVHDLSTAKDLPSVLVPNVDGEAVFCEQVGRYVYAKPNSGAFSISATDPLNGATVVDANASELYGCEGSSLLYRTSQGQVVLARINADGKVTPVQTLKFENVSEGDIEAELAPGGKMAAVRGGANIRLVSDSGQVTQLDTISVKYAAFTIEWASSGTLVGLAFTPGQNNALLALNVGDEKAFRSLDNGSVMAFAGPGQTGKGLI